MVDPMAIVNLFNHYKVEANYYLITELKVNENGNDEKHFRRLTDFSDDLSYMIKKISHIRDGIGKLIDEEDILTATKYSVNHIAVYVDEATVSYYYYIVDVSDRENPKIVK